MLQIRPYHPSQLNALLQVELTQEQKKIIGSIEQFIYGREDGIVRYSVFHEAAIIGYFALDTDYAKKHYFCPDGALGFRCFGINKNHQGKGLGTLVMQRLLPFLSESYSSFHSVYLTVLYTNLAASRCYLKAGFEHIGELYYGDPSGPNFVMKADLSATSHLKASQEDT